MTIKVFSMDEVEWWVGESLGDCIMKARDSAGSGDAYSRAEMDAFELDEEQLRQIRFTTDDGESVTFAEQLQREVEKGGEFPRLFAVADW